jgi:hypothetical protein
MNQFVALFTAFRRRGGLARAPEMVACLACRTGLRSVLAELAAGATHVLDAARAERFSHA